MLLPLFITIARVINAYRDAEQFDHPTDDRSLTWHLLIIPQYVLSFVSLLLYYKFADFWLYTIIDLVVQAIAFEFFLWFFRRKSVTFANRRQVLPF